MGGHSAPRQHRHRLQPVILAAGVAAQGRDGVPAVGLARRGDLARVQPSGEEAVRLRAQRQQLAEHVGHVPGLVHQVRLVGRRRDLAAGPREVHRGDHVTGAGPGLQQVLVRAAALPEPRGEHDQRERAARRPRSRSAPGRRVADHGQQRTFTQVLPGHPHVRRLGQDHLSLAHPVPAGHARGAGGACRSRLVADTRRRTEQSRRLRRDPAEVARGTPATSGQHRGREQAGDHLAGEDQPGPPGSRCHRCILASLISGHARNCPPARRLSSGSSRSPVCWLAGGCA